MDTADGLLLEIKQDLSVVREKVDGVVRSSEKLADGVQSLREELAINGRMIVEVAADLRNLKEKVREVEDKGIQSHNSLKADMKNTVIEITRGCPERHSGLKVWIFGGVVTVLVAVVAFFLTREYNKVNNPERVNIPAQVGGPR